jgi:site-specific DNA-methyltransferase (adenine-specific)
MALELNKIYCADCLDFMKVMEDNSVDLVLTDPPYGIGITGKVGGDAPFGSKGTKIGGNNIVESKEYHAFDDSKRPDKEYFYQIQRISKNQIIFGGNYFADVLPASSCWLVWDKDNTGNFADCELCWTSFKTAVRIYKHRWNGMLQEDMKHKEKREHPTQKPEKLIRKIIEDYSEEGQTIFDPFLGSGTTAVACINTGRNFIGIEKDEDYFKIAQRRIKDAQEQGRIDQWF